ncbi:inositol monophosphatase family protein [Microlunatus flavus]|uniref:Histidinol-phosphatase n=1 Tax=Microlunatus flavus TaxID=1036181 RepID=A0A1H9JG30_9ACTN|nr:inositol monophosphatase [Microlunatus flavus]SEQ85729.1 myo-inositol-1(or 4)-monophosphatase [Microlunatus flavus]
MTQETAETWLEERARVAEEIIRDAGAVALGYFDRLGELTVRSKGVQDVVSEADVAVEELVKERLAQAFPHDAFLGEETGHADFPGSEGIWVVDPIDGTQPFVSGLRTWCVSIAYVRDGRVRLGLVNNPAAGELFVGATDRPATLNGAPISPSTATSVSEGLTFLGCSARVGPEDVVPVLDRLMRRHGMFVRNGSGALGLCDVACGRLVGYVEPHINAWDCLGAVAVLDAAGARVSDYLTPETLLAGNKIVAATPAVFDELVSILG